ncbi:hypothetical protein AAD018_012005 [Aestuariibius insulae]|uniref:hypothetical protein n=1 Tax=Aestuariibius insulae TaxID=2058287 RepID=UPI00345E68C4
MMADLEIFSSASKKIISLEVDEEENEISTVIFGQRKIFYGEDLFDAFCEMRRFLEKGGFLVRCNGARLSFFPSNMSRSMSNGLVGYVLTKGQAASRADLVRTFDQYSGDDLSRVDEQKEFFQKWLSSL